MKRNLLSLFIITAFLLSGCERLAPEAPVIEPPSSHTSVADTYCIQTKGPDSYEATITNYHQGIIGVPEGGGNFPLVLLIPGSTSASGLTYLVEKLARNGYVAISLESSDEDAAIYSTLADEQLQRMHAANDGDTSLFPINLTNKIDFSKVGLFGHGKGAEIISKIAIAQRTKGISNPAMLSVAPIWPDGFEQEDTLNGATSVLIPSLSPDYDSNCFPPDSSAQITLLNNANRNYFDSTLTDNDALEFYDPDELLDQLAPKLQQTFLEHFALDFYNASLKGRTEGTIYAANAPAPIQMYGYDVLCRLTSANETILANALDDVPLTLSSCTAETMTIGNRDFKRKLLYQMRWESIDASVTFQPEKTNFRGHYVLSLRLRTNAADPLNNGLLGQSFTIVLKDGTGNSSAITLPGCPPSLLIVPDTNENTLILNTDILLSEFKKIELSDITSVELRFDQSNSGSVYLENIILR